MDQNQARANTTKVKTSVITHISPREAKTLTSIPRASEAFNSRTAFLYAVPKSSLAKACTEVVFPAQTSAGVKCPQQRCKEKQKKMRKFCVSFPIRTTTENSTWIELRVDFPPQNWMHTRTSAWRPTKDQIGHVALPSNRS